MAVDIEGFDIVFSKANANHAKEIDQSIARMSEKVPVLTSSLSQMAKALDELGKLKIDTVKSNIDAVKNSLENIDGSKLNKVFEIASAKSEGLLSTVTSLVNMLGKVDMSSLRGGGKTEVYDEKTHVKTTKETNNEPSSQEIVIPVKFDEKTVLSEIKNISDRLVALFKEIPVSLKQELDLTYFEQKAKELKAMFSNVTVPVTQNPIVQKTEGVAHKPQVQPETSQLSTDTTKVLEAAFERMEKLTSSLVDGIKQVGATENTVFTELRNDIQGVTTALQGLVDMFTKASEKEAESVKNQKKNIEEAKKSVETQKLSHQEMQEMYNKLFKAKTFNLPLLEEGSLRSQFAALERVFASFQSEFMRIKDFDMSLIPKQSRDEINTYIQQINQLGQAIHQISALNIPLNEKTIQISPILAEIEGLRTKISAITAPFAQKNAEDVAKLSSKMGELGGVLDGIAIKIHSIVTANEQMQNSALAIDAQKEKVRELEKEWQRLVLTQQHLNADGSYTDKAKRLVSAIEEEKKKLSELTTSYSDVSRAEAEAAKISAEQDKAFAKMIAQAQSWYTKDAANQEKAKKQALAELERLHNDYYKRLAKMEEADAKRRADIQARWNDRRYQNSLNTPEFAQKVGERALQSGSVNDLANAQKRLKAVMDSLNPDDSKWKELNNIYQQTKTRLDDIKKSMEGVKAESKSLLPNLQNLAMQFGVMFSAQQLMEWTKHMVEVRAQFELQQIALRSIIRDKQKADEVFAEVQQLALKSPFSIMQLNTYTKQIAAYGVEADKLVGTTKELADVSAGLGVDMGRLILAYGQVKTANFLRATEVRQFTEAGLNITQELANYFTELNGKMVTAGEVTEMITKRMVKFEDVAEVFHRVTSAGGMFYNMQEKQAEGIHGQMQRIGDAYSIMLNDIGKSNESAIATVLASIREMISSWRTIASVTSVAASAIAAYMGIAKFAALTSSLNKATKGFQLLAFATNADTAAQLRNNAAVVANPYALAAAAVAVLVAGIYELSTSTNQLTEDLERMREESFADTTDSVAHFKELADTVRDVSKSYSERKDAMDEIQRAYGDILPKQQLEMEGIMQLKDGYKDATEAIREYYRIKLEEEEKSKIDTEYSSQLNKTSKTIADIYTPILSKEGYGASSRAVQGILSDVIERLKDGSITSAKAAGDAFVNALVRYYDITDQKLIQRIKTSAENSSYFRNLVYTASDYTDTINEITGSNEKFADITDEKTHAALQLINKDFEKLEERVKNVGLSFSQLDQLRTLNERAGGKGFDIDKIISGITDIDSLSEEEKKVLGVLQDISKALEQVGLSGVYTWQQIYDATANNLAQMQWFGSVQKTVFTQFKDGLNQAKYSTNELARTKFAEQLQAKIDSVDGTPTVKEIKKIIKAIADANKLDYHLFDWVTLDVKTSFESARKEFDTQIKDFHEKVLQWKSIMSTLYISDKSKTELEAYAAQVTGLTKEMVDNASVIEKANKQGWNALGGHDKEKKGKGADHTEQLLRNRVNLLKEANKMYEKLSKEYDKETAAQMTYNNLLRQAKDLKIESLISDKDFTNKGTLADMNALSKMFNYGTDAFKKKYANAWNELMKQIGEQSYEVSVDINKESREKVSKELEKMLGSYQLFIELDKMGVDGNIVQSLFNIDYTSLDDIYARFNQIAIDSANEIQRQNQANFEGFKSIEEAKAKMGSEFQKMYTDGEKKITDTMHKEYESRMKDYMKYLKKSYGDAVNAQVDAYNKLRAMKNASQMEIDLISANKEMSSEKKQKLIEAIRSQSERIAAAMRDELGEKLNEIQWKEFKDNPIFEKMFGDLDKLGEQTIDALLSKIRSLKKVLSDVGSEASTKLIREMAQYEDKLFAAKAEKSPFTEYIKALKEIRKINKEGQNFKSLNADLASQSLELSQIDAQIEKYQTIVSIKENQNDEAVKGMKLTEEQNELLKIPVVELNATILRLKQEKNAQTEVVEETKRKVKTYEQALKAQEAAKKKWQQYGEIANQVLGAVREGFKAFEHDADAKAVIEPYLDGFEQIMNSVVQMGVMFVALGVTINDALGIIGIIATAVSAIFTAVSSLNDAHDAALENQIKKDQRAVDKLQRAFENLSDAIDNAFSGAQLGGATRDSIANLKEQNKYYSQMIAAESSKKDSDEDKIIGWQNQIEDNLKEMKELKQQFIDELGGIATGADILSAAQEFVDAWADAFDETGDGLKGLQDNWDSFMRNIIKKQAYMKVADHWIANFSEMINKAFDDNGQVDYEKLDAAMEYFTGTAIPQIDSFLIDFNKATAAWGGIAGDTEASLSGLTAGIQGVTEETAQILEALLNSMRYYVADTNDQLRRIVNTLVNPLEENPFLKELKSQTNYLASIDRRLASVISATKRTTGSHLNVFTS